MLSRSVPGRGMPRRLLGALGCAPYSPRQPPVVHASWNWRAASACFCRHRGRRRCFSTTGPYGDTNKENENNSQKTALVVGSSGALGSAVSRHLSSLGATVLGADVVELPPDLTLDGWELDGFVSLPEHADLSDLASHLVSGVDRFLYSSDSATTRSDRLHRNRKLLDVIVCASGGWQPDPPERDDDGEDSDAAAQLENTVRQYTESIQRMIHMNLDPVVASGFVAQHLMDPNGLMVVVGATAALQPTPGMMGYGLAKCASHHVVRTLGACTAKSIETKAIRQAGRRSRHQLPASIDTLTVVGILPTMIDTPANRRALLTSANANADASVVSQWTKPRDIAVEIGKWMECPDLRPHSGSLVKVRPSLSSSGQGGTTGAVFELVR